jgi:pimeloyl-ACP methyl ester carboxylesterase
MGVSALICLVAPSALLDALGWVWPPALLAVAVWSFARARRALRSRARAWILNPVLLVLTLTSLGGAYETVSRAIEPDVAMRGQLVDVGPYRLHLECTGSGSPTVVLEPGGGAGATTMAWIAPAVARDTRVCVYDRAGRGWSDAAQTPPDAVQISTDLHTLLARAHVPGPYVLAGHSFGGLYVMTYADRYPDEVAGLVLVDSTAPKSGDVPDQRHGYSVLKHLSSLVSTTARLGLGRAIAATGFAGLPPESRDEARSHAASAEEMSSFLDEFGAASRSEKEAGRLGSLDPKPLVVLTADRGNLPGWAASQDEMAALSTNSLHRVVPGATHDSLMENPRHAAAVSAAIADVVASIRSTTPLARP